MGPALMPPTCLPSPGQHSAPAAHRALLGLHLTSATTALGPTLCAHHHANSRAAQAGGLYPGGQASTWNGVLRVKTDGWVHPATLPHTDTDTWRGAASPHTLPDIRARRLGLGFLTAAFLSGPCLRLPPLPPEPLPHGAQHALDSLVHTTLDLSPGTLISHLSPGLPKRDLPLA